MDRIKSFLGFAKKEHKDQQQVGGGSSVVGLIVIVIWLICAIVAAVLAWRANVSEKIGMHVIYTICALFNGPFYLIYYLVFRVMLGYEYNFLRQL